MVKMWKRTKAKVSWKVYYTLVRYGVSDMYTYI